MLSLKCLQCYIVRLNSGSSFDGVDTASMCPVSVTNSVYLPHTRRQLSSLLLFSLQRWDFANNVPAGSGASSFAVLGKMTFAPRVAQGTGPDCSGCVIYCVTNVLTYLSFEAQCSTFEVLG